MLTYKTEYSGTYRMVKDDQEELEAYQKEYYTREFIITVILIYWLNILWLYEFYYYVEKL